MTRSTVGARGVACLVCALLLLVACRPEPESVSLRGSRFVEGAVGGRGVVATEVPAATSVALEVLDGGGNAVDAAVAAAFAVSVARPQSCGLGGGGFLLTRSADGATAALDFRETAPAAAGPDLFAEPGLHRSRTGHLVVGVPGMVAGLAAAVERLGTIALDDAVRPAERLARDGVEVSPAVAGAIASNAARFRAQPAAAEQFLPGGQPPAAGEVLVQPDLAETLGRIAREGPDAFYAGGIAERIVASMEAADEREGDRGIMTAADLAAYEPVWREPLVGTYRGHEVIGMPPPSSGGIAVQQMLNILEGFDLAASSYGSAENLHRLIEAQKIAFADRAAHLADPDAVEVPTQALLDPAYAEQRREEIDPAAAGRYDPGDGGSESGTSHLSVIDADGGVAALTCTVEGSFGSAVVAPGTGFVLNNQLTDFTAPGTANEPGPGKRPRSSMSPTIVVRDGVPILVHGGSGGAGIIMGSLLPIVAMVDHGMDIAEALDAPRLEAGGGAVTLEDARLEPDVPELLRDRGHRVTGTGEYARLPRVQAAGVDPETGQRTAVADPRTERAAAAQDR